MNKLLCSLFVFGGLATGCASVNTATVDGKTVVTSTEVAPVIFTVMGAPLSKCLGALAKEGVTTVVDADGPNENLLISRISNLESCQATGTK
jgi:hypothetical protein